MFKFLSKILINWPVKAISFSLILILFFAVGARNVRMATGNDTIIETDSEVYQNNLALESEFGGESIIVLFEGNELKDLLTPNNLKIMRELENTLKQYDEIYTVVSPATVITQISGKQYDKYKDGIKEVSDGLGTMGSKLKEIGANIEKSSSKQAPLPSIDAMMAELNTGLSKMIEGQEKLKAGTASLVNGYSNFGTQLQGVSVNLQNLSKSLQNSPQQAQQLSQISSQLGELSQKMTMISENSAQLPRVPETTISGLQGIQNGLGSQLGGIDDLKESQEKQLDDMKKLGSGLSEMGTNLITIGENLETMISYSDAVSPSIPTTQRTLDKMAYDDNGNLRSMFEELIVKDKYMMFIVKLNGDVSDSVKSDIYTTMKDFIKKNPMESVETIVSGKPVLDNAIRTSMKSSMQKMMGLSVVFMIIVLFMTFRVKWRLLPLVTILIAVVGTVGLMGWLNIPVTMVSMAVFPILIGLGIDYSIQFQGRYVEEMEGN